MGRASTTQRAHRFIELLEGKVLLAAQLVKDINIDTPGSNPQQIADVNGEAFFITMPDIHNAASQELWKSDGTTRGTKLVRSLADAGAFFEGPGYELFTAVGNTLYFTTDGMGYLWKSDGTAAGTMLIKSLEAEPGFPADQVSFAILNDTLYFTSMSNDVAGLWKTDGTVSGTREITNVPLDPTIWTVGDLKATTDKLYFVAHGNGDDELWVSDGTSAGTLMLEDMPISFHSINQMTAVNGTLFFTADDVIWKSDGTSIGTVSLLEPYTVSGIDSLTAFGGNLIFMTDYPQLWESDGTVAGTHALPGFDELNIDPSGLKEWNGSLYDVNAVGGGLVLWKINPGLDGAELVKDVPSHGGITAIAWTQDTLFFADVNDLGTYDLWKSDGTSGGTVPLKQLALGNPYSVVPPLLVGVGSRLYFAADDGTHGSELWTSDGTSSGTRMVKDVAATPNADSMPRNLTELNGKVYFSADDGIHGRELWTSDGTQDGTRMVKDIAPGPLDAFFSYDDIHQGLTTANGLVFFDARDGENALGLWVSDGTTAGTHLLNAGVTIDFLSGAFADANGTLFFIANRTELWKSDGSVSGTVLVKDISPSSAYFVNSMMVSAGDSVFFSADDGYQAQLWRSDGTSGGTQLLKNFNVTYSHGQPQATEVIGSTLYFSMSDDDNAWKVWQSDGTAAGTRIVRTAIPHDDVDMYPYAFLNGAILWSAAGGKEMWRTTATGGDAELLFQMPSGSQIAVDGTQKVGDELLFFALDDAFKLNALWRTDGTTAGTSMVVQLPNGDSSRGSRWLANVDGTVYFTLGDEIWKSDGTLGGTSSLASIRNLDFSSAYTYAAGNFYFEGSDSIAGYEPWKLPIGQDDESTAVPEEHISSSPQERVETRSIPMPSVSADELTSESISIDSNSSEPAAANVPTNPTPHFSSPFTVPTEADQAAHKDNSNDQLPAKGASQDPLKSDNGNNDGDDLLEDQQGRSNQSQEFQVIRVAEMGGESINTRVEDIDSAFQVAAATNGNIFTKPLSIHQGWLALAAIFATSLTSQRTESSSRKWAQANPKPTRAKSLTALS